MTALLACRNRRSDAKTCHRPHADDGYSFVEMMVVMLILPALATIAIPRFLNHLDVHGKRPRVVTSAAP